MEIPLVAPLRQTAPQPVVTDLPGEVRRAWQSSRLAWRVRRVEFTLHQAVNHAATVLSPGQLATGEPVKMETHAFFELPDEIGLRLLGRAIDIAGDEGPVELGKLEGLCEALFKARRSARFRRTLAGAVITLAGGTLAVERAPARKSRAPKRP